MYFWWFCHCHFRLSAFGTPLTVLHYSTHVSQCLINSINPFSDLAWLHACQQSQTMPLMCWRQEVSSDLRHTATYAICNCNDSATLLQSFKHFTYFALFLRPQYQCCRCKHFYDTSFSHTYGGAHASFGIHAFAAQLKACNFACKTPLHLLLLLRIHVWTNNFLVVIKLQILLSL